MGAQWKTKIKGENAASKGRIFTKLSKEIMVAARAGADPDMNHRLRAAIDAARSTRCRATPLIVSSKKVPACSMRW